MARFARERVREGVVALAAAFATVLILSRFPGWDSTKLSAVGLVVCVTVLGVWELATHGVLGGMMGGTLPTYTPPTWAGGKKGQLRRDTAKLVRRLREYVKTGPAPIAEMIRRDGPQIWERSTDKPDVMERWERQKAELDELFSADVQDIVRRYREYGLLDQRHAMHITWDCEDVVGLSRAATKLELLARALSARGGESSGPPLAHED